MEIKKEYLGVSFCKGNKKLLSVDRIHGKKYHLYEWIKPNHCNSLAVFRDEKSVKSFIKIINEWA